MNQLWQEEARRMGGQTLVQLLTDMRDNQLDMRADMEQLTKTVSTLQAANEMLLSGFPANDVDGHRRYHESVIEWRELRNKLVREALAKVASAGALAAFGWLALAIWKSIRLSVTQ
jgi:hypothetical protein